MMKLIVTKKRETFKCDPTRVIARFYKPGSEDRIRNIFKRVLGLAKEECKTILTDVLTDFANRHYDIERIFLESYERIKVSPPGYDQLSKEQMLLLGAYFTKEYSIESTALFNPSMVPHPDQSNLSSGSQRFILSFRAIGEGHISSIVFRSGVIDAKNNLIMDSVSPYAVRPAFELYPEYDRHTVVTQIKKIVERIEEDLGGIDRIEFPEKSENIAEKIDKTQIIVDNLGRETRDMMKWLAKSDYEITFDDSTAISERVIFPVVSREKNGIEDARFVRFTDDNGDVRYFATYTAYCGHGILPMLLETKDFLKFKMCALNGRGALNKGMALFPRKVNGRYMMISRQDGENTYTMQSDNVHFWDEVKQLDSPQYSWEFFQIGNCGSPIETEKGWLLLTHGVGPMRTYCIGIELLDINDPARVIAKLEEPLIIPRESEREGYVPNVVYSCGGMLHGETLVIPYGVSDTSSRVATVELAPLFECLLSSKK